MSDHLTLPAIAGAQTLDVMVDADRYDELAAYMWYAQRSTESQPWIVKTNIQDEDGSWRSITMARIVDGSDAPRVYRRGFGLDYRRENLYTELKHKKKARYKLMATNKSGYRGVYLFNRNRKWNAQIGVNGKRKNLGFFKTAEEAARAYDAALLRMSTGDVSNRLNFPPVDSKF